MTAPLVAIPHERQRQELRRAVEHAQPFVTRRMRGLAAICLGWMALGWILLGLSFHSASPDRAQAAFLAGLLVGNAGPAWTLLVAAWHHQD